MDIHTLKSKSLCARLCRERAKTNFHSLNREFGPEAECAKAAADSYNALIDAAERIDRQIEEAEAAQSAKRNPELFPAVKVVGA